MKYTEIFIDDLNIDLGQDPITIPITYELVDIKNLNNRSGSKSKTITVPRTKNNEKVFGFPYNMGSESAFSKYEYRRIRIEENGYPIFSGLMQLTEVTRSTIKFFCFAELSKFKGLSGTKMLSDLNLKDLEHVYNETIFDTWDGTYPSGVPADYFYPLVDYGEFEDRGGGAPEDVDIFIEDMRPGVYLRRLIKQICVDNGYSLVTSFFNNPVYDKILLLFTNEKFLHDRNYTIATDGFYGNKDADQIWNSGSLEQNISFEVEIYDDLSQWSQVDQDYTAGALQTVNYGLQVNYDINDVLFNPPAFGIVEHHDGIGWTEIQRVNMEANAPTGFNVLFMGGYIILQPGDKLRFRILLVDPTPEDVELTVYRRQAQLQIAPSGSIEIIQGDIVQLPPNLPEMKQIDLFKWCYQMFNWVVYVDDVQGAIYIETFDDYYGQNESKDFSNKLNLTPEPVISYQSTDFKRKYDFRYLHDDEDYNLNIQDGITVAARQYLFGDGRYYLTEQGDPELIGEVGFSPTVNGRTFLEEPGEYVEIPLLWKKERELGVPNYRNQPRIAINAGQALVLDLSDQTKGSLKVETIGDVEEIPLVYFQKRIYGIDQDNTFALNLSFSQPESLNPNVFAGTYLVEEFYAQTINNLSVSAKLTAYFNLTEIDINSLDFSVLWYIDEYKSFFRLNRIVDYQPGKLRSTKVELVKRAVRNNITTTDYAEIT